MDAPRDLDTPPDSRSAAADHRYGPVSPSSDGPTPGVAPFARPGTVTVASVLWIVLGGLLSSGAVFFVATPEGAGISLVAIVLVVALGLLFVVLGLRLRRGADTRVALTALGAVLSLALWPALFAVPAIVLQYQSSSKAWFASHRSARPW